MKYVIITLLMCLGTGLMAQKADTARIQTSAICEMCKEALEYELTFTKGVKFVELNLENKVLTIAYKQEKTDINALRQTVSKTGYHADWIERDNEAYKNLPFCCRDGSHDTPIPQLPTKKPNGIRK